MTAKESKLDKEVDIIEDKLEQEMIKENRTDYKKDIPAFIWILKGIIVLDILYSLFAIFDIYTNKIFCLVSIVTGIILLVGLFHRKRWSWYFGLSVYALGILYSIISLSSNNFVSLILLIVYIFIAILLYWHKDYLDK